MPVPRRRALEDSPHGNPTTAKTRASFYEDLTGLVRELFGFLERDEGMKYRRKIAAPECTWTWASAERKVAVRVVSENAGVPWIIIGGPERDYGLFQLIRATSPDFEKYEPEIDPEGTGTAGLRDLLGFHARFLREQGRLILDGDAGFFASLQGKVP